jgi:hypothetical protein
VNALEPRHLHVVERWTLGLAALVIAAAFVATSRQTAFAVTAGAGLMALNAWSIRKITDRAFRSAGSIRPGFAVLLFNLKMLLLIAAVLVAVKVLGLDAIGFLLGISVFPVAVVAAALRLNLGATDGAEQAHSHGDQ